MPKGSLHNRFEGFGSAPSEKVWSNIANSLDDKKKKRRIIIWWTTIGVAASILVFLVVSEFNSGTEEKNGSTPTNSASSTPIKNTNHSKTSQNDAETEHTQTTSQSDFENRTHKQNEPTVDSTKHTDPKKSSIQQNAPKTLNPDTKKEQFLQNKLPRKNAPNAPSSVQQENQLNLAQDQTQDKSEKDVLNDQMPKSRFSLSKIDARLFPVALSKPTHFPFDSVAIDKVKRPWRFSLLASTHLPGQDPSIAKNQVWTAYASPSPGSGTGGSSTGTFLTQETRPIALRFVAEKEIIPRLSLLGGLDAGLILSRSHKTNSSDYRHSTNVSLGVPVGIGYQFIRIQRFRAKMNILLLNEFVVYHKYDESITLSSGSSAASSGTAVLESNDSKSQLNSRFFGGFETGLELSYGLTNQLQLTVQPAMKRYYRLASNYDYNTFFGVSAGLSWTLK